jgi:hypothetical protein
VEERELQSLDVGAAKDLPFVQVVRPPGLGGVPEGLDLDVVLVVDRQDL